MAQRFTLHPTHPQPRLVRQVAAVVRSGGVIAYPTDSCYALGCGLGDAEATRRIRAIRGIDETHPLTLMLHDLAQLGHFARLDNRQFRIVRQGVPGPYTFLLPATREVPRRLHQEKRSAVGFRVPSHPFVAALVGELGEPLLSSTLTLVDEPEPLNDPDAIDERIGGFLDAIIDAGQSPAKPTTVVDLAVDPPAIVRLGLGDLARLGLAATIRGESG
ncbi:MAG TPA: L-threonylcarbamoyladenylate synthase [Casimicrobiaceae bacterium]|nr:L-threonylcarbamoyladenylate synthase [Casimicrobiaceae bacterium]